MVSVNNFNVDLGNNISANIIQHQNGAYVVTIQETIRCRCRSDDVLLQETIAGSICKTAAEAQKYVYQYQQTIKEV